MAPLWPEPSMVPHLLISSISKFCLYLWNVSWSHFYWNLGETGQEEIINLEHPYFQCRTCYIHKFCNLRSSNIKCTRRGKITLTLSHGKCFSLPFSATFLRKLLDWNNKLCMKNNETEERARSPLKWKTKWNMAWKLSESLAFPCECWVEQICPQTKYKS